MKELKSSMERVKGFTRSKDAERYIDHVLTVINNANRRKILELLAEQEKMSALSGVATSQIIQRLGLAPSTISVHLRLLVEAQMVTVRREGSKTYYRLANGLRVQAVLELIYTLKKHTEP